MKSALSFASRPNEAVGVVRSVGETEGLPANS